MEGLFSIIWLIVIIAAVSGTKKKKEGQTGQTRQRPVRPIPQPIRQAQSKDTVSRPAGTPFADKKALDRTPVTKVKDNHDHKFGNLSAVLEDRNNDWLAKQLREEAKHKNDLR